MLNFNQATSPNSIASATATSIEPVGENIAPVRLQTTRRPTVPRPEGMPARPGRCKDVDQASLKVGATFFTIGGFLTAAGVASGADTYNRPVAYLWGGLFAAVGLAGMLHGACRKNDVAASNASPQSDNTVPDNPATTVDPAGTVPTSPTGSDRGGNACRTELPV